MTQEATHRFKLYRREQAIFPFTDYAALMGETAALALTLGRAPTVLEFGPGLSTRALIEGGAGRIVSCEHEPLWRGRALRDLGNFSQVEIISYTDTPEISIELVDGEDFDLAFVDAPVGEGRRWRQHPGQEGCARLNTVLYSLARAPIVILHDARREAERRTLKRVQALGHLVHDLSTGSDQGMVRIERRAHG